MKYNSLGYKNISGFAIFSLSALDDLSQLPYIFVWYTSQVAELVLQ